MSKIPGSRHSLQLLFGAASIIFMILFVAACGSDKNNPVLGPTNNDNPPGTVGVAPAAAEWSSCDPNKPADIIAQGEAFTPSSFTIAVNGIVKWKNGEAQGGTMYWIISEDGSFSTTDTPIRPGQEFCVKFTSPGTFNYHCAAGVTGTVIVKP